MSAKKTIPCTIDPLESLMTMRHFSKPLKKKPIKLPRANEILIDLEKDSYEEIIRKLVLNNQLLRTELNELRVYVDGTFCTSAVHNRFSEETEKTISGIVETINNLS